MGRLRLRGGDPQAGPDQSGFFKFFEKELGAAIREGTRAEVSAR